MLIGGGGEKKTLRLVAQHADIWHTFGDPAEFERKSGILRQHCADVGRDPAEIEISVGTNQHPDEVGPALRALGVSLFTTESGGPDYDLSGFATGSPGGTAKRRASQESVVEVRDGWPRPRKKMPGKPAVWKPAFGLLVSRELSMLIVPVWSLLT